MKIDDGIVRLAAKKLAKEATIGELEELDRLMSEDTDTGYFLRVLFNTPTDGDAEDKERAVRLFEKIRASVKGE
jgi:hypothetical protein